MKKGKHYFNLESRALKNSERLIFFNLSYGYKKFDIKRKKIKYLPIRISSEWSINEKYWDKENYRPSKQYISKNGKQLKDVLNNLETTSYNELELYINEHDKLPHPKDLKERILIKLGRQKKQSEDVVISEFIEGLIKKRLSLPKTNVDNWSKKNSEQYKILVDHIKVFEYNTNSLLSFNTITEEIYWDFFDELNNVKIDKTGTPYLQSTIAKICKNLKAVFNCAIKENINVGFNFKKKEYKIQAPNGCTETYLNENQLKTIVNSDVSHSKEFTHARNYIILSCFTGLRIGDMIYLHTLSVESIKYENIEYKYILTKIRKSNKNELIVAIPLLKPVKDLLSKNNNRFPKFPSEQVIRKNIKKLLSHLEFNKKEIVRIQYYLSDEVKEKKMPQSEIFKPHDCRGTYVTNLKSLGIHNELIEPITHPKIKYSSILDRYNKATIIDNMVNITKSINSKTSKIYCT